jgi:NADPH-dependent ferric siderophore reductase
LLKALRAAELPSGDGFTWVAAEFSVARALRRALIEERGANRAWVKAAAYWKLGTAAVHENIED